MAITCTIKESEYEIRKGFLNVVAAVFILLGALILFLAFATHKLKWYFLISGYNTLSKADKQKVDVEGLAKEIAKFTYVLGALFIVVGTLDLFDVSNFMLPLLIVVILLSLLMVARTQKYMKNVSKKSKRFASLIVIVTIVIVGILMVMDLQEPNVEIHKNELTIHGMYGDTFALSTIENVELVEELPEIDLRTNGSALGSHLKGHFRFVDKTKAVLFVDTNYPPFVKFEVNGKIYYFNQKDANETKDFYEQMKQ